MRDYYSIKMRATLEGKHVSGVERIVTKEKIPEVVSQLPLRPNQFDFMNIKIEKLNQINFIEKSLNVKTIKVESVEMANNVALEILQTVGIQRELAEIYIKMLHTGAATDKGNMRGAMIVSLKGERLEKDKDRGVRTVNVDFENREEVTKLLKEKGYTERTVDALALSTKNLYYPDILAEYCISDQPDYTTGYVATKTTYYRILNLKDYGNPKGGRIYFVKEDTDIDRLYQYLETKAFLIKTLGDLE